MDDDRLQRLQDLQEQTSQVRSQMISMRSRNVYSSPVIHFLRWVYEYKPHLITDEFRGITEDGRIPTRREVVAFLAIRPRIPPFKFDDFAAPDFVNWILSVRKADGSVPVFTTFKGYRSALNNLFRDYGYSVGDEFKEEMTNHFKGLKRQAAHTVAVGDAPIKVGKDPLDFPLYRFLARQFMKNSNREYTFGHAFLTCCWNLMCRSNNVVSICFSHMEWKNDALRIYFSQMKNDQFGERPRDPRHIYANPFMPEICPILSLGTFKRCFQYVIIVF